MTTPDHRTTARDMLDYMQASPTSFHCVAETCRRLEAAGFTALDEAARWPAIESGDRRFVVRGDGSIIAWRGGSKAPAEGGFRIVGAHTDSPNLRLKPQATRVKQGYLQFDVETYGGVLLATWPDRDLGLAGRVFIQTDTGAEARLVRFDIAICRIPNAAIHLNRTVNTDGLVLNKHRHLAPVVGPWSGEEDAEHALNELLATELGVDPAAILGHELSLYDVQPGAFSGLNEDFLQAARLDNQAMCHAGLCALIDAGPSEQTAVLALFDHEECGSQSARGADGSFLADVLIRLAGPEPEALQRAVARSFQISADMAHGVHPNYDDLHDGNHLPKLNAGPVIKTNNNQRYATDAESGALFRRICKAEGVPFQEFVNRADLACGTTIGPISSSRLGVRTVDVGNAMWSMHSIREMAGAEDPAWMTKVMTAFLAGA